MVRVRVRAMIRVSGACLLVADNDAVAEVGLCDVPSAV